MYVSRQYDADSNGTIDMDELRKLCDDTMAQKLPEKLFNRYVRSECVHVQGRVICMCMYVCECVRVCVCVCVNRYVRSVCVHLQGTVICMRVCVCVNVCVCEQGAPTLCSY